MATVRRLITSGARSGAAASVPVSLTLLRSEQGAGALRLRYRVGRSGS